MIEIISARENESDQAVFFKITIGKDIYEWHGSCPKDADPQAYFEAMKDKLHFLILQKMYRDGETWADWQRYQKEGMTPLQSMLAWIADGCRNKIIVGYYKNGKPKYEYQIIEKQPWRSTHPPGLALTAEVDKVTTLAGLKAIVKKAIMA